VPPGCAARACDLLKRRRQRPGRRPVPGPDCGSRITRRPPQGSAATASRCCDSSRPDDLATELNPHKTELNPIRQSPTASHTRARSKRCLPCRAVRWAAGHGYHKGSGA